MTGFISKKKMEHLQFGIKILHFSNYKFNSID